MSVFNYYPKISYKVDSIDSLKAIDITTSVKMKDFLKTYRGISYSPYVVRDGERPDTVSSRIYGTPGYDWIVMLANDIYDIYDDWPKDSETLNKYIIEKYGSLASALSTVKYYYDSKGNIIDYTSWTALSASERNSESEYQYEVRINTNKSKIKLVKPIFIPAIDNALKSIVTKPIL